MWLGVDPVPAVASPQFQAYDAIVPSASDEAVPLNVHTRSVQLFVNAAVGGLFGGSGVTVIDLVAVGGSPSLSVTVS